MKLNTAVTAVATIVASSMMMSSTDAFAGVNSQLSLHPQTKSVRNTSGMLQMVASNEVEDAVKPRKTRQVRDIFLVLSSSSREREQSHICLALCNHSATSRGSLKRITSPRSRSLHPTR
mmetsp:Transcript_18864/g.27351  ORF Transcript_18864/g.27351 Transcript_18864/m.27351 type:complete len:119 (+) Transcript_18864:160-516(+)